jgi:hypothetical protein
LKSQVTSETEEINHEGVQYFDVKALLPTQSFISLLLTAILVYERPFICHDPSLYSLWGKSEEVNQKGIQNKKKEILYCYYFFNIIS